MKTFNLKQLATVLLATLSTCLISCKKENNDEPDNPINNQNLVLKGSITDNVTLKSGLTYQLDGEYIVESGATLTIEPGVKIVAIYDDIVDYILVKQDAKIVAQGTADQPIVMTSEKEQAGAWGGIHICGKAHTNAEGGKGSSEIGGAVYGGTDDNDNSGTLQYVRVEYTGYAFDEDHEANGITFYAVGKGTTVDHCQAYMGSDDGFEFFGGSVCANNMVSTNCSDDSFDWTEGWNGSGNQWLAYQEKEDVLGYDCDCLIEADNNEKNYAATPIAHPTLSDLVLVGNNSTANKRGIRLRRGTQVTINQATICGKSNGVTLESDETETALKTGVSILQNIETSMALLSEKNIYTNDDFIINNTVNPDLVIATYEDAKSHCTWITGRWVK